GRLVPAAGPPHRVASAERLLLDPPGLLRAVRAFGRAAGTDETGVAASLLCQAWAVGVTRAAIASLVGARPVPDLAAANPRPPVSSTSPGPPPPAWPPCSPSPTTARPACSYAARPAASATASPTPPRPASPAASSPNATAGAASPPASKPPITEPAVLHHRPV